MFVLFSACSPLMNVGNEEDYLSQNRDSSFLVNQNCPLDFKKLQICGELLWDKTRVRAHVLNSMQLRFWKKSTQGKPVDPQDFQLESTVRPYVWLWMDMTEGGHGSSPVNLSLVGSGEYAVDEVVFSMRGKWKINVDLVNESREVLDQSFVPIWIAR